MKRFINDPPDVDSRTGMSLVPVGYALEGHYYYHGGSNRVTHQVYPSPITGFTGGMGSFAIAVKSQGKGKRMCPHRTLAACRNASAWGYWCAGRLPAFSTLSASACAQGHCQPWNQHIIQACIGVLSTCRLGSSLCQRARALGAAPTGKPRRGPRAAVGKWHGMQPTPHPRYGGCSNHW
jgi:hypothetical protein